MTRLRRLTPTICAFHLGFGLDKLFLDNNGLSGCVPSSLEDQLIVFDLGGLPFC